MSFITMKLNLSPGACIFEAGTGSGSFTHFLARTVARGPPAANGHGQTSNVWQTQRDSLTPAISNVHESEYEGRVYSFEFHAERVERARKEFAEHGLDTTVVLEHRNVCKDGFGLTNKADAVFLDLPAPWEAVPFAKEALRQDICTRICCFSPCIEQVLRTVSTLSEHGFTDVTTYESLVRTHESLTNVAPLDSISQVIERIRQAEAKRETRRQLQIANSKAERERRLQAQQTEGQCEYTSAEPDVRESVGETVAPQCDGANQEATSVSTASASLNVENQDIDTEGPPRLDSPRHGASNPASHPAQKRKSDDWEQEDGDADQTQTTHASEEISPNVYEQEPEAEILFSHGFRQKVERRPMQPANVYSRPYAQMRGHTSYLTFALLLPRTT